MSYRTTRPSGAAGGAVNEPVGALQQGAGAGYAALNLSNRSAR